MLASHEAERRLLVTPGMVELGDREAEENERFGERAAGVCDLVVLVGEERSRPIRAGLDAASFPGDRIHVVANASRRRRCSRKTTRRGDVVLFENDLPDLYVEGGNGSGSIVSAPSDAAGSCGSPSVRRPLRRARRLDHQRAAADGGDGAAPRADPDLSRPRRPLVDRRRAAGHRRLRRRRAGRRRAVSSCASAATAPRSRSRAARASRATATCQVDVVINAIHGTGGEDGSAARRSRAERPALRGRRRRRGGRGDGQARSPSSSSPRRASRSAPHTRSTASEFTARPRRRLLERASEQGMPCYAKPATLGSSIGVARVHRARQSSRRRSSSASSSTGPALVEPALDDFDRGERRDARRARARELRASAVEQPVRDAEAALSFEDKYLRGAGKGGEGKAGGEGGGAEGRRRVRGNGERRPADPGADLRRRGRRARRRREEGPPRARLRSGSCATTSS